MPQTFEIHSEDLWRNLHKMQPGILFMEVYNTSEMEVDSLDSNMTFDTHRIF